MPRHRAITPDLVRTYLEGEGWSESGAGLDHGLMLFSHPSHPRRQIVIPASASAADWEECLAAALAKLGEMTATSARSHRLGIMGLAYRRPRRPLSAWIVAAGLGAAGAFLLVRPGDAVDVANGGCMDRAAAVVAASMAEDFYMSALPEPRSGFHRLRRSALAAAGEVEDMRVCYDRARSLSPGFDRAGTLSADIAVLEGAVPSFYTTLAAFNLGEARAEAAVGDLAGARDAAKRISFRLASAVSSRLP